MQQGTNRAEENNRDYKDAQTGDELPLSLCHLVSADLRRNYIIPDAAGKVLYVWFDAPIGYISNTIELCARGTGRPAEANEWWASDDCGIYHFIGEDNTIFHCVVWIAMLQAEGSYKLPRGVIVNQFMNIQFPGKEETKISKSRGSAVWIDDYIAEGGDPEALRYYLTLISTERSKTTYKPEDLIQRQNSELANVLGNFVNRILSFTAKNYGPQVPDFLSAKLSDIDREFLNSMQRCHADTTQLLDSFQFKAALERIMEFARACNKYVDDKAPWTTKKTDNEGTKLTLNTAIAAIKFLGIVLRPFMPRTSDKILHMLLIDPATAAWNSALIAPLAGSQLGEAKILFQKVETASS
ncbi:MAG: hypothetical protein DCC75_06250 [Proteobacteria bacterium]|nr:MAG: hypothetical protein DCC75_06250 [Pseudomonadota bacterium]